MHVFKQLIERVRLVDYSALLLTNQGWQLYGTSWNAESKKSRGPWTAKWLLSILGRLDRIKRDQVLTIPLQVDIQTIVDQSSFSTPRIDPSCIKMKTLVSFSCSLVWCLAFSALLDFFLFLRLDDFHGYLLLRHHRGGSLRRQKIGSRFFSFSINGTERWTSHWKYHRSIQRHKDWQRSGNQINLRRAQNS